MAKESNGNGESKIRKVLFNEVSLVIAIIGAVFGAVMFFLQPYSTIDKNIALIQKDIDVIESNHLVHIQTELEEIKIKDTLRDTQIEKNQEAIIKLLTIHNME